MARIHCLADRCILLNHPLYFVNSRPGSATRSNQTGNEMVRNGFILAAGNLRQFQESETRSEKQKMFLNGPIAQFVFLAVYSAVRTRSWAVLKNTVKSLKDSGLRKLGLKKSRGYQKLCGGIYNFSPYLGALVLVFYLRIEHGYYSSLRKGNG